MPREGVPYPERLLCSLRCELRNIWNALNGKLHSVNGVEGDGQGNVDIVSGNAAVVVTPQPLSNEIEISLDQSQLPAAAVTSVNGQTGAVNLAGTDIETAVYGANNSATQDISTARTAIQTANQNINAETTARQNADSALQTNINNITASLPGAAAAAVAADPTIASLVSADSQNVKLTGNQSISGVKTVITESTGIYSTQIANSNKVRNEINTYAVTTTGTQSIAGQKVFTAPFTCKKIEIDPSVRVGSYQGLYPSILTDSNNNDWIRNRIDRQVTWFGLGWQIFFTNNQGTRKSVVLEVRVNHTTGVCSLFFQDTTGTEHTLVSWTDPGVVDQ